MKFFYCVRLTQKINYLPEQQNQSHFPKDGNAVDSKISICIRDFSYGNAGPAVRQIEIRGRRQCARMLCFCFWSRVCVLSDASIVLGEWKSAGLDCCRDPFRIGILIVILEDVSALDGPVPALIDPCL